MLRKAVPIALCAVALLVVGCEKKEPEDKAPVRVVPSDLRPPAGMAPIPGMAGTFIDAMSATVGEYTNYLRESGQSIPEEYRDLGPDSPEAAEPVTGLSRQRARRMAIWQLKRLPTRLEWDSAPMLRMKPYPWNEDGSAASAEAQAHFVRDWKPGSQGESAARKAREELRSSLRAEAEAAAEAGAEEPQVSPEELQELRELVRQAAEQKQARFEQQWQEWKPAFFGLLEKRKKVAELEATARGHQNVVDILTSLAAAKGRLAARLKTKELSQAQVEQEIAAYEDLLGQARTRAQQRRSELQQQTAAMQDELVDLTREVEQLGAEPLPAVAAAEAALEEPPARAGAERDRLQQALQQLEQAPDLPPQLPALDDMAAAVPQLETKIQRLGEEVPEAPPIEGLTDSMQGFGEAIGKEFLQEKLLIDDLRELTQLAASKKGVEARLNGLRGALGLEEEAEAEQQQ
jgi:hypothetical protein